MNYLDDPCSAKAEFGRWLGGGLKGNEGALVGTRTEQVARLIGMIENVQRH